MIAVTSNIEAELRRYRATLARYREVARKTDTEVVQKKGRDLGIRLYRGFRSRRWGVGKTRRGIAWREHRARVKAGRGTLVRLKYIDPRWASQIPTFQKTRPLRKRDAQGRGYAGRAAPLRRLTRQQRLVHQELLRREKGISVLAASFLWFRRRQRKSGTEFVRNKSGQMLGFADAGGDYFRIVGFTPGLEEVDARYGEVSRAIRSAMADTEVYLARKQEEAYLRTARDAGYRIAA